MTMQPATQPEVLGRLTITRHPHAVVFQWTGDRQVGKWLVFSPALAILVGIIAAPLILLSLWGPADSTASLLQGWFIMAIPATVVAWPLVWIVVVVVGAIVGARTTTTLQLDARGATLERVRWGRVTRLVATPTPITYVKRYRETTAIESRSFTRSVMFKRLVGVEDGVEISFANDGRIRVAQGLTRSQQDHIRERLRQLTQPPKPNQHVITNVSAGQSPWHR